MELVIVSDAVDLMLASQSLRRHECETCSMELLIVSDRVDLILASQSLRRHELTCRV